MMNPEMTPENVIKALEPLKFKMDNLANSLRGNCGVLNVHTDLALRRYESGPMIEAYVEAELEAGVAIAWWLDVSPTNEGWKFAGRVLLNDAVGDSTLRRFPVRTAQTLAAAVEIFDHAIMEARRLDWHIDHVMANVSITETECPPSANKERGLYVSHRLISAISDKLPIHRNYTYVAAHGPVEV